LAGAIYIGIPAAVSQYGLNLMQGSTEPSDWTGGFRRRLAAFSPMKSLSDDEYECLLQDKLLKIEAEIALLDEQIAGLRATHTGAQGRCDRPS
jgi:hypothetical protein